MAGDEGQLRRALVNLAQNAVQACADDGSGQVTLACARNGSEVIVSVRARKFLTREKRIRFAFPNAPGPCRFQPYERIVARQPLAISGDHIIAFGLGDRCLEAVPFLGKNL